MHLELEWDFRLPHAGGSFFPDEFQFRGTSLGVSIAASNTQRSGFFNTASISRINSPATAEKARARPPYSFAANPSQLLTS